MSRLRWDVNGERLYETGVDRVVLYINNVASAWSGVQQITRTNSGGDHKPVYQDGIKTSNIASSTEAEGSIRCLSFPTDFLRCIGMKSIHNGLYAANQKQTPFSLVWRSKIGSDTEGDSFGYRIHIVYNALVVLAPVDHKSIDASAEPDAFSWDFSTLPVSLTGLKPTAYFMIDSRHAAPTALVVLEELLYGTDSENPTLPTAEELSAIFA